MMIRGAEKCEGGRQNCHNWMCSSDAGMTQRPAVMAWWTAAPDTRAASTGDEGAQAGGG